MKKNNKADLETLSIRNIINSFKFWPRVFRLLWDTHRGYLLIILTTTFLQACVPAILLICTKNLINGVIFAQQSGNFNSVMIFFSLLIGIGCFNEILSLTKNYFHKLFESLLSNKVNIDIMKKINRLSLTEFENSEVQDQLKRAQNEANHRPYTIFMEILGISSGLIMMVSTASILVTWKWWVASIIILIPLISFFSFLKIGQKEYAVHYQRAPRYRESWYLTYLLTRDSSFKETKMYKLGNYFLQRYTELFLDFYKENKQLIIRRTLITFYFQIISQIIVALVILLIIWDTFNGRINIGELVGMIQAVMMTQSTSQGFVQSILSFCQNNLYMQQLFAFFDLKSTDQEYKKKKALSTPIGLDNIESIEIKNLSFSYPESDRKVLKNINLKIKKGETLAIVGKNGSGKSTLVKLLCQLYYNYEGEIRVNNNPIYLYNEEMLLKKIGIVFQDFVHYEMSIRENIGFGDLENIEQDKMILSAAKRSGIESIIDKLPNGIDTQLGKLFQGGYQLSGGQWQRIAIARSFMRNADLYILDEPSSFLDPQAEIEVFEKFQQLINEKIGIFISHRFSSVTYADKIAVMDDGEIVEIGTHEELMSFNGLYKKLYMLQMSNYQNSVENEKSVFV